MSESNGTPTSLPKWITFVSIALVLIGILLIFLSQGLKDGFLQSVILGLGLALAPSGILGLLADWLIFGHLIEALHFSTQDLGQKQNHFRVK